MHLQRKLFLNLTAQEHPEMYYYASNLTRRPSNILMGLACSLKVKMSAYL